MAVNELEIEPQIRIADFITRCPRILASPDIGGEQAADETKFDQRVKVLFRVFRMGGQPVEQEHGLADSPAAVNDQQLRTAVAGSAVQDVQFALAIDESHDLAPSGRDERQICSMAGNLLEMLHIVKRVAEV
jgi:hypothetical protein